jgi:hypothetical protein
MMASRVPSFPSIRYRVFQNFFVSWSSPRISKNN